MTITDDRGAPDAGGAADHRGFRDGRDARDPRDDHDESRRIERILRQDGPVEPSSTFSLRVMAAVRQEAALPPPIAFPWRRLLVGLAACALLTAGGVAALMRSAAHLGLPPMPALPPLSLHLPALQPAALLTGVNGALGLTAAALAGTYLLTRLAHRLVKA
jgi:hypothetical protein